MKQLHLFTMLLLWRNGSSFPIHSRIVPSQLSRPPSRQHSQSESEDGREECLESFSDEALFASLRARQGEIAAEGDALRANWRSAKCKSFVAFAINENVCRAALSWPYLAVGTSKGSVVLMGMTSETESTVTSFARNAHAASVEGVDDQIDALLDGNGGGGVTAMAMGRGLVVSGGRDGLVKVWRLQKRSKIKMGQVGGGEEDDDDDDQQLELDVVLKCGGAVSAVAIEGRAVWAACLDGKVSRFHFTAAKKTISPSSGNNTQEGKREVAEEALDSFRVLSGKCVKTNIDLGSPVLCLAVDSEREVVACGTADGEAVVLQYNDDDSSSGSGSGEVNKDGASESGSVSNLKDECTERGSCGNGNGVDGGGGSSGGDFLDGGGVVHKWVPHKGKRCRSIAIAHGAVYTGGSDGSIKRRWFRANNNDDSDLSSLSSSSFSSPSPKQQSSAGGISSTTSGFTGSREEEADHSPGRKEGTDDDCRCSSYVGSSADSSVADSSRTPSSSPQARLFSEDDKGFVGEELLPRHRGPVVSLAAVVMPRQIVPPPTPPAVAAAAAFTAAAFTPRSAASSAAAAAGARAGSGQDAATAPAPQPPPPPLLAAKKKTKRQAGQHLHRKGHQLLVSGSHDGTLRVWDIAVNPSVNPIGGLPPSSSSSSSSAALPPRPLYGFGGYKPWLGSVVTDGVRLASDGFDNQVIIHDFGPRKETKPGR